MNVYLLHNKSEALDAFKVFKVEVENQCAKQIKIVRSDRCGEYYGRYTKNGQTPGLFAKFLQEGCGRKQEPTLLDMVQSMLNNYYLPKSLWTEALKTVVSILNHVPTKVFPKAPFELFKGWKSSSKHMRVWGCLSEVRIYNPQEKKLDLRTISEYFIGYAKRSKGFTIHIILLGLCNQEMPSFLKMT